MRVDDVNTRILVELWTVGEIARRSVMRQLDKRAVCTLRHFLVMDVIAGSLCNVTPSTLASRLGCSRSNATQLVGELKYREWVTSAPEYSDLRSAIVRLSDAGLAAYASFGSRLAEVADVELAPVDVETRRALAMVLSTLAGFRTRL